MADRRRRGWRSWPRPASPGCWRWAAWQFAAHKPRTIPIGPDGTITACAKEGSGKLRMVAAATDCDKHEQVVTWNQKGPKGDPGAKGDPGPQGPPGAAAPQPGDVVIGSLTIGTHDGSDPRVLVRRHATPTTIGSAGGGAGAGKAKFADVEVLKDIDGLTLATLEGHLQRASTSRR